jgi:hypothetical protein
MSPRTPTLPPTDRGMWRKLLAKVHADAGGTHELFIWACEVHEHVAGDYVEPPREVSRYAPASRHRDDPDRIPYDPDLGVVDEFLTLTHRALSIGKRIEEPHKSVLIHLIDCDAADHGRRVERQCRGASYKQLAAIGHRFGMTKRQRCRWYDIASVIPLSDQHAHHILGRLQKAAA